MWFKPFNYTWELGAGGGTETGRGVANKFYIYDPFHSAVRMVMDSAGKMGIGITAPDSTLHVVGSLRVTGGARFSGLPTGAAAKRVMADANGTLYLVIV
jgi:hypothetical protein